MAENTNAVKVEKKDSEKLMDLTCREFTEKLSTKAPVPGGGGASAMCAALGAALCNMVGNLTIGKKKYKKVEAEIEALMVRVTRMQEELLELVEKDAESFAPLAASYKLPAETEEQRKYKEEVQEQCLKEAASAPMAIMRKICNIISMISVFSSKGSSIAVSDAGCAAAICSAALRSAALNVFINTRSMKDREFADQMTADAMEMLDIYAPLGDHIYDDVMERLVD
ncbi:MAG: cyclodeaminase/cyclohydrolase family protein [Eubacteriales bacterium]|nr:cyclodeaminase/cyclohydrolase family protein [Eubacteriales bacterium]